MRGAEASGGREAAEPAHWIVTLLDAPMILFQPVIQIAVAAVADLPAERPADGARIGIVPICRDPLRDVTHHHSRPAEEASGHREIPRLAEQ